MCLFFKSGEHFADFQNFQHLLQGQRKGQTAEIIFQLAGLWLPSSCLCKMTWTHSWTAQVPHSRNCFGSLLNIQFMHPMSLLCTYKPDEFHIQLQLKRTFQVTELPLVCSPNNCPPITHTTCIWMVQTQASWLTFMIADATGYPPLLVRHVTHPSCHPWCKNISKTGIR